MAKTEVTTLTPGHPSTRLGEDALPHRAVLHLAGPTDKTWVDTHTGRWSIATTVGLIVAALYYLTR
jgi:hypothetical protein